MKNKVFYGEYSLRHWIDLILKRNIKLPEYQRPFVWKEEKIAALISSLKNGHFIPPVTIGRFNNDESEENLILDGQQRLTSIFLTYLGIAPDDKAFERMERQYYAEDEELDEEELEEAAKHIDWDFNVLLEKGRSKEKIISSIDKKYYKKIDIDIEDMLDETYLGFCYLLPGKDDSKYQQQYYSTAFRRINNQGELLLPQESREALYYLNKDLVGFFKPEFINLIKIRNTRERRSADYIKYLSLLNQYNKNGSSARVAWGYARRMEVYYEEFIDSIVGLQNYESEDKIFKEIPEEILNGGYVDIYKNIEEFIQTSGMDKVQFNSIIDVDVYLFGLIDTYFYLGEKIDVSRATELFVELNNLITEFKSDERHRNNPGQLNKLRDRMVGSYTVYQKYYEGIEND